MTSVAVLIPCFNEELAIAQTVTGLRNALPGAQIYVYDNNSTDKSAQLAQEAGAIVRYERLQGKGNVVSRMFADIDAEMYLLVDGDATYDPKAAPEMIARMKAERLDFVNGIRTDPNHTATRQSHRFGNAVFTKIVAEIFGHGVKDMLSGYKLFSRRFVKSFPALSTGFEIETELVVHALELRMPIGQIETTYAARAQGSESKLSTIKDGLRIGLFIAKLIRDERPLTFFASLGAVFALLSVIFVLPVLTEFYETGLVPRFPTFILSVTLMLIALLNVTCGLILSTITQSRREAKRIAYLAIPGIGED